jgi:hypothetical protein
MDKVYASDLRQAIANGQDDPLFRAIWVHDGTEHRALLLSANERSAARLLHAALDVQADSLRQLTAEEMLDDELVNEVSARCLQLDGYYLYEV